MDPVQKILDDLDAKIKFYKAQGKSYAEEKAKLRQHELTKGEDMLSLKEVETITGISVASLYHAMDQGNLKEAGLVERKSSRGSPFKNKAIYRSEMNRYLEWRQEKEDAIKSGLLTVKEVETDHEIWASLLTYYCDSGILPVKIINGKKFFKLEDIKKLKKLLAQKKRLSIRSIETLINTKYKILDRTMDGKFIVHCICGKEMIVDLHELKQGLCPHI